MFYLEKIKPSYFDLLQPLAQWKILSIQALKEESQYQGSFSGFYKIISKLEKNMLIDSFINSWSNEKFVYLLPDGISALGESKQNLNINRELRFHDSIVSKIARELKCYPQISEVFLDFQTTAEFPLLERVPDCMVRGKLRKPFSMAIEVELTQKSQDRVKQIFRTYSNSKVVNQVLYITDKRTILSAYTKYLNELGGEIVKEKFLFLLAKSLVKKKTEIHKDPVYFKDQTTCLEEIFKVPLGN